MGSWKMWLKGAAVVVLAVVAAQPVRADEYFEVECDGDFLGNGPVVTHCCTQQECGETQFRYGDAYPKYYDDEPNGCVEWVHTTYVGGCCLGT